MMRKTSLLAASAFFAGSLVVLGHAFSPPSRNSALAGNQDDEVAVVVVKSDGHVVASVPPSLHAHGGPLKARGASASLMGVGQRGWKDDCAYPRIDWQRKERKELLDPLLQRVNSTWDDIMEVMSKHGKLCASLNAFHEYPGQMNQNSIAVLERVKKYMYHGKPTWWVEVFTKGFCQTCPCTSAYKTRKETLKNLGKIYPFQYQDVASQLIKEEREDGQKCDEAFNKIVRYEVSKLGFSSLEAPQEALVGLIKKLGELERSGTTQGQREILDKIEDTRGKMELIADAVNNLTFKLAKRDFIYSNIE